MVRAIMNGSESAMAEGVVFVSGKNFDRRSKQIVLFSTTIEPLFPHCLEQVLCPGSGRLAAQYRDIGR